MKISLSAGHGLNTPGKRTPDGLHEWEFNSGVVRHMMNLLSNYDNVAVLRLDDPSGKIDIPLEQRADRANEWGANVHIDIHANAYGNGWNDSHGIETYVHTSKPKEAVDLADEVQRNLVKDTGLTNRGVKTADFYMLDKTKMTAILCECGFMTNKIEAGLLKSNVYREKVANAIVDGLVSQYRLKKRIVIPQSNTLYKVQVGAFAKYDNAEAMVTELGKKGFKGIIVKA